MPRPMTITEKILAAHADHEEVSPGDILTCSIDLMMGNDITAPLAIAEFERVGATELCDPDKLAIVLSHFAPAKDVRAAVQCAVARSFARRHELRHFFDEGRGGIEHALLPERGLVLPGDVVLGADSHSCTYGGLGCFATGVGSTDLAAAMITGETWFRVPESMLIRFHGELQPWVSAKDLILTVIGTIGVDGATYRALEFAGDTVQALSVEQRLTLCNMAVEAGAKSGIVAPDATTRRYVEARMDASLNRTPVYHASDPDAEYHSVHEFDASQVGLRVACPNSPDDVRPLEEVAGVEVDQVFIGSCTNARIEDLRTAATVLRGQKVASEVRCIVIPATQGVWREALDEGLLAVFADAGCSVGTATCGPCLGGHHGVLGDGDVCLSTSNRNFPGRMGHRDSKVYLAGPAVAAATAVAGRLTHPDEIVPTDESQERSVQHA